ncbi:MAG: hypothetical protein RLZ92_412 [Pseudomonadota bacterium]|jgi:FixJ family two-component response regulator
MAFSNHNATIYLVDDDFSIRDSLKILIQSKGWSVNCFESAEAFLANYNPSLPGCLILDVRMPLMSGLDLQETLVNKGISIPIIFISGNSEIADSAKAFRAGALDFFEKPFENQLLLDRIVEAVTKDMSDRDSMAEKNKVRQCYNSLTSREKEVLQLVASSYSTKEAARVLDISHRTIDAHRARVMEKMQANNLASLVAMVMNCDLLKNQPTKSLNG